MATKNTTTKNKRSSNYGGKRPNSGRKPIMGKDQVEEIRLRLQMHGLEEVELEDPVTKQKVKVSRMEALFDVLFKEALKGNAIAIREYFNRQVGKAQQKVEISGVDGQPIEHEVNLTNIKNIGEDELNQILNKELFDEDNKGYPTK